MILTREIWEKGKSSNNGWNNKQIRCLGVLKFYKGWAKDIIGKNYPENIINEFLSLKDVHFIKKMELGEVVKPKILKKMNIEGYRPCVGAKEKAKAKRDLRKQKKKEKKALNKLKNSKSNKPTQKQRYKLFLKSEYWLNVRAIVLKRDEYKCGCGNTNTLQVHHLTYKNHLKEHEHLEDLITVCESCHKKIHKIK